MHTYIYIYIHTHIFSISIFSILIFCLYLYIYIHTHIYMYNWITLLYTWSWHYIVKQLYFRFLKKWVKYAHVLVTQLCLTLCEPIDYSPQCSSVHGILQARILEWIAIPFSRGSSDPGIEPWSPKLQEDLYHLSYQGTLWLRIQEITSWPLWEEIHALVQGWQSSYFMKM